MDMETYALIIAGGVGARFWPRSREHSPKQLLEIIGKGTMIQNTVFRLDPIVPKERVLIVTNAAQEQEIRRQLPQIPAGNILVEPAGRNTAPAIALGAEVLRRRTDDCVMIVLPADHIVHDVASFQETLLSAVRVAEESRGLVTIGIRPTRPETGYGYIQYDDHAESPYLADGARPVVTFAEKPNLATARRFLESGDFLWNSGMFIWRASTILGHIADQLPDLAEEMHRVGLAVDTPDFPHALDVAYREMKAISIDYGVMERATDRYVLPADFGWNDLGSWDEVYRIFPKDEEGNATVGEIVLKDVKNCHITTSASRVVAAVGVEDLLIIDTDDAVLVCRRGRSQDVKEVVDQLRKRKLARHL